MKRIVLFFCNCRSLCPSPTLLLYKIPWNIYVRVPYRWISICKCFILRPSITLDPSVSQRSSLSLSPTPAPRVSLRFFYRFIPSHIHLRMMISLRGFLFLFSFACSAYAPFGVQTNYGIIVSQSETLEDIKASKHMFLRCVFSLFILARRCNCISPLERSRNDSQLCRVSPYQIRHCIRRCEAIETKFTIFYLLPLV